MLYFTPARVKLKPIDPGIVTRNIFPARLVEALAWLHDGKMRTVNPFTSILRVERQRRGWDQARLGHACDLPAQRISSLELGREAAGPERQRRIATALGMRPTDLFDVVTGLVRCMVGVRK